MTPRRRTIKTIKALFQGLHPYRFKDNPLELEFAKAWQYANEQRAGQPTGVLAYLMDLINRGEPRPALTERDHLVAATVIQWLGSPVGINFIHGVVNSPACEAHLKLLRRAAKDES